MNYPDSVDFLYALGNEIKTAKLGLERIRALLEALGSPHRRGRFVHGVVLLHKHLEARLRKRKPKQPPTRLRRPWSLLWNI